VDLLDPSLPLHQYLHEDLGILSGQFLQYYPLRQWIQADPKGHHILVDLEAPEVL